MNGIGGIIFFSSAIIVVLVAAALFKKEPSEHLKLFLFCGIAVATVLTTAFLAAATVYENEHSVTGGPVHWHADFQIYSCGQAVKLKTPSGLSNRIGTPLLHEHGDSRVHVEGTVQNFADVSLGNFFAELGGKLTNTLLLVPTDQGEFVMQNGMNCPGISPSPLQGEGRGEVLQIFVYHANEKTKVITQEKLTDLPGYVLSASSKVPPGDCLIFEFGPEKSNTDHICGFTKIAINNGDYSYSPPREEGLPPQNGVPFWGTPGLGEVSK